MMNKEPLSDFGELLRRARRDAALTQEALAERAGISVRTIADLERGVNRAPRRDTLAMLSDALDLSQDERRRWERLRVRHAMATPKHATPPAWYSHQQPRSGTQTAATAPPVFISYHPSDADVAHQARAHLVAHGVATWMDQYDVPIGAYLPDEIDRALSESGTVVGILSPDAAGSRDTKNVWDWAIQNGKRLILMQVKPTVIPHRYVAINSIDASGNEPTTALRALLETLGVTPVDEAIPETRYTQIDDVNIAYQVLGDGPVDLVYCFGFVSNIEVIWEEPRYARYLRRLATFSRLIFFDRRGIGASDRISHPTTLEHRLEDVRAVMDAAGADRAVLMGYSEGAPLAIQFAAAYPQRVAALILYGSYACGVQRPDYPDGRTPKENEQELIAIRNHWGDESHVLPFVPSAERDQAFVRWFARMARLSATPRDALAMAIVGSEIDVRHLLPTIRTPTLVLHRTGDRVCKLGEGRYVADHIPGARFVELPGDDHAVFVGNQDAVLDEIEAFLVLHDLHAGSLPHHDHGER